MSPALRRSAATAAAAVLAGLALAGPAFAHVTVSPEEAAKGGFTQLSFSVPNERGVDSVRLEVAFPEDHPIAFVSVQPKPGWTYTVQQGAPAQPVTAHGGEVTEVVTRIVWEGGTIKPGEYDTFNVSAGPLPEDADQLLFPALQTYADGEVVRWIDEPTASGDEPEHPAPVLTLTEPVADQPGDEPVVEEPASEAADDDDSDDGTGLALGALAVSAVALVGAGVALVGVRRTNGASAASKKS